MILENMKRILTCLSMVVLLAGISSLRVPSAAVADDEPDVAERTVMLYLCGSDLEYGNGLATYNLEQILAAKFSASGDVNFIIMTGGTTRWLTPSSYLYDPASHQQLDGISTEYNQIWEAKGADATEMDGDVSLASKLLLLDADGVSGDGEQAKQSPDELMSDPKTLKAFIDYGVANFPAKKYDLILWDHGGGPVNGYGIDLFGFDEETEDYKVMSFAEIVDAISDNAVTRTGDKFDFIDFDACLMSTVEIDLALAGYTNYYIASAETEPGYGQDYTGWLNALGENSQIDTFTLGKKIVDDHVNYYDGNSDSPGFGMSGTLAVVDMGKLMEGGFAEALVEWGSVLASEINEKTNGEYAFYDELESVKNSIMYGGRSTHRDFGNIIHQIAVAFKEVSAANIQDDLYSPFNAYKSSAGKLLSILEDPEIIYASGTKNITADPQMAMDASGQLQYEQFETSGLYIFFPDVISAEAVSAYYDAVKQVIDDENIRDANAVTFLNAYLDTMASYALMTEAGRTISELLEEGLTKDEVTCEVVKEYWEDLASGISFDPDGHLYSVSFWDEFVAPLFARMGGEEAVSEWLEDIVAQQVQDAIVKENMSATEYKSLNFAGYRLRIADTDKKVVESAYTKVVAEYPVALEFIKADGYLNYTYENHPEELDFSVDVIEGSLDYSDSEVDINDSLDKIMKDYLTWYTKRESSWNLDTALRPVFALQDANGVLHAVQVTIAGNDVSVRIRYTDAQSGIAKPGKLLFSNDGEAYTLTAVYPSWSENERPIAPSSLLQPMEDVVTSCYAQPGKSMYGLEYNIPLTKTPFTLSADNADGFKLVIVDIDEIDDIADVDDDGEKVKFRYVVRDIYENEFDVTEVVEGATETVYGIDLVSVEDVVENGQVQGPKVVYDGTVLEEGVDYVWSKADDDASYKNPGSYEAVLVGKGKFTGKVAVSYKILAAKTSDGVITLNKTSATLKVGETLQLTGTLPSDFGPGFLVAWSSLDKSIATVSNTGLVTAVSPGTVTIRATSAPVPGGPAGAGDSMKAVGECAITVVKADSSTPDTPDNPDTPATPDTPDNPDTPDTPDTPDNPEPVPTPEDLVDVAWTRLAGNTALDTMAAIIEEGKFEKGGTVVLASLEGYWDALTAAGIAGLEDAPVVMALQDELGAKSAEVLKALAPKKIIVCGGKYWISEAVVNAAAAAAGTNPETVRLAGEVAVNTAEEIAAYGKGKWSSTAIVATVGTFQDALAAAPVSYAKNMPIYLAQFDFATKTGSLAQTTIDSMKANSITKVYIAGGTYWLPKGVSEQLKAAGIQVLGQLMGETAVETSGKIAEEATSELGMSANNMGAANVAEHYDALASAAFCGKNNSILVLVSDANRSVVDSFVKPNAAKIAHGYVFGGTGSVSDASLKALTAATE